MSPAITLELQHYGGHVGFINREHPGELNYWLEERIAKHIQNFLAYSSKVVH